VRLRVLTPREASIFACITDSVVVPEPLLPAVRDTSAVEFFDWWLGRSPRRNAIALRALLYAIELSPLAGPGRTRLRRLHRQARRDHLARLQALGQPQLGQLTKLVAQLAFLAYYGDDAVMRRVGYDPDERIARGRELRAAEARAL